MKGLNDYGDDAYGCTSLGCIPECRFYPEYGRIEDEEVIQKHKDIEEHYSTNEVKAETYYLLSYDRSKIKLLLR